MFIFLKVYYWHKLLIFPIKRCGSQSDQFEKSPFFKNLLYIILTLALMKTNKDVMYGLPWAAVCNQAHHVWMYVECKCVLPTYWSCKLCVSYPHSDHMLYMWLAALPERALFSEQRTNLWVWLGPHTPHTPRDSNFYQRKTCSGLSRT